MEEIEPFLPYSVKRAGSSTVSSMDKSKFGEFVIILFYF